MTDDPEDDPEAGWEPLSPEERAHWDAIHARQTPVNPEIFARAVTGNGVLGDVLIGGTSPNSAADLPPTTVPPPE